jgi:type IV secretory pathway TrbF-like protein
MGLLSRSESKQTAAVRKQQALNNTPPVVHNRSVSLFAELFGDPQANAARWFVCSCLELVVIVALVLTIKSMLPLKRAVPYTVEVTPTGVVARVVEASQYKPTPAMIKSELAAWAEQMLVLDPYQTKENLRKSTHLLRGKAVAEHNEFLAKENPFGRLAQTPTLVRTVSGISVDASKDGIAFIFLTTTERVQGEPTVKRQRFTVHYTLATPEDEEELLRNPAGLAITHFELAQDNNS